MFGFPKIFVSLHPQSQMRLGYGVMVTHQILVLTFLVRVQVAQQTTLINDKNPLKVHF